MLILVAMLSNNKQNTNVSPQFTGYCTENNKCDLDLYHSFREDLFDDQL